MHVLSKTKSVLLHVTLHLLQFVTSIEANLCTQQRITLLTCTKHNCTSFHISQLVINGRWPYLLSATTANIKAVHVCLWIFFSNKPVIWMWLRYSKPIVYIRQRQIAHWETQCFSPERYKKSPRRQQIIVQCSTKGQRGWRCSCQDKSC